MATTGLDLTDWPLLTRFYGLTPFELARIPRAVLTMYRKAIPEIVAEETLIGMQIADFPYMEQNARRETHEKLLSGTGYDPTPVFDPNQPHDQVALQGMGIQVVHGDG